MKLNPDIKLRKKWFVDGAMAHPAKGHLGLWWEMLERYTEPGQTVLDPMAGIGSTLMACMMGRNVVCVELETHFLEPMLASWEKMQLGGPMLGHQMGQALILRGDARQLPLGSADAIITSPPYENTIVQGSDGIDWSKSKDMDRSEIVSCQENSSGRARGYTRPVDESIAKGYSQESTNIGNLRSSAYWEAMQAVYQECHRVLIPGGIIALVVKGFTREKKYVDLPQQTADLLENLGFEVFDRWTREVPLSFWRVLQKQNGNWAEALRFEHVIAARCNCAKS